MCRVLSDLIQPEVLRPHFPFFQSLATIKFLKPNTASPFSQLIFLMQLLDPPYQQEYTEEYLITLSKHHPTLFPPFLLPVDSLDTQQMASVQPQVSSTGPRLPYSIDLPHCHTHSSGRQLASYQGKWKHTLLHTPLLGQRGGKKRPYFDWTAD